MQNATPEHEKILHGSQMGLAHEHDADRERGVDYKRAKPEEPDEDRPPGSDPLGQQGPGRMKDRRRQHQRQREKSHEINAPLFASMDRSQYIDGLREFPGSAGNRPCLLLNWLMYRE